MYICRCAILQRDKIKQGPQKTQDELQIEKEELQFKREELQFKIDELQAKKERALVGFKLTNHKESKEIIIGGNEKFVRNMVNLCAQGQFED